MNNLNGNLSIQKNWQNLLKSTFLFSCTQVAKTVLWAQSKNYILYIPTMSVCWSKGGGEMGMGNYIDALCGMEDPNPTDVQAEPLLSAGTVRLDNEAAHIFFVQNTCLSKSSNSCFTYTILHDFSNIFCCHGNKVIQIHLLRMFYF